MSATDDPRLLALQCAHDMRFVVAGYRRRLRSGETTLERILTDVPLEISSCLVVDIVRWPRTRGRSGAWLERLGRAAVRDQINLFVPLGRASLHTRAWVAEYATYNLTGPKGRRAA